MERNGFKAARQEIVKRWRAGAAHTAECRLPLTECAMFGDFGIPTLADRSLLGHLRSSHSKIDELGSQPGFVNGGVPGRPSPDARDLPTQSRELGGQVVLGDIA
jgi:hypothetical protein